MKSFKKSQKYAKKSQRFIFPILFHDHFNHLLNIDLSPESQDSKSQKYSSQDPVFIIKKDDYKIAFCNPFALDLCGIEDEIANDFSKIDIHKPIFVVNRSKFD